jgi:hypothetical protein
MRLEQLQFRQHHKEFVDGSHRFLFIKYIYQLFTLTLMG